MACLSSTSAAAANYPSSHAAPRRAAPRHAPRRATYDGHRNGHGHGHGRCLSVRALAPSSHSLTVAPRAAQPCCVDGPLPVSELFRRRQWQQAVAVAQGALRSSGGVAADLLGRAVCTSAIGAFGVGLHWEHALCILWSLVACRLEAEVVAMNAAISACERSVLLETPPGMPSDALVPGPWRLAIHLIPAARAKGVGGDVVTCGAALSACDKAARWLLAAVLLSAANRRWGQESVGLRVDVVALSAAVSALAKSHLWRRARAVIGALETRGMEPETVATNASLTACEKAQAWLASLAALTCGRGRSLRPTLISCNAAASACAGGATSFAAPVGSVAAEKKQPWEMAWCVAEDASRQALRPDAFTRAATLSACEKASRWSLTLRTLGESDLRNRFAHSAAISACEKCGRWAAAAFLLRELRHVGRGVAGQDVVAISACISACEKGRRWAVAQCLLEEMSWLGVSPNTITYNAAISACDQGSKWQWHRLGALRIRRLRLRLRLRAHTSAELLGVRTGRGTVT